MKSEKQTWLERQIIKIIIEANDIAQLSSIIAAIKTGFSGLMNLSFPPRAQPFLSRVCPLLMEIQLKPRSAGMYTRFFNVS